MLPLLHSGEVPSWDERERAEAIRLLRERARSVPDAFAVRTPDGWRWVGRLPYPYCVEQ